MSLTVSAAGSTTPASAANDATTALGTTQLASKDVFMKLLVAELRYQNPLNPADGLEFVGQLSQFTELEQVTGMREDMAAIRKLLETPAKSEPAKEPQAGKDKAAAKTSAP